MNNLIKTLVAVMVTMTSIQALADVDTVYCSNKKHGTELYLKDGKTLSMVNLAESGLGLVDFGDMFVTDENVEIYEDDDDSNKVYIIDAYIADFNFDWEVTAQVNPHNNTIDVHMVDTDAYDTEYEYTLNCNDELNLR